MPKTHILFMPSLMFGVFAILTTELGAMGIIPIIANEFNVSVADAGWVVSLFALIVAFTAPITPLLAAKFNAQKVMLICLGVFSISSLAAAFTTNFLLLLFLRAIPAFFHPVYCALSFSVAAKSVPESEAAKATSKIFMAVSAGMTLGIPFTSYIASKTSLQISFIFFALINAIAFIATLFFVKSNASTKAKSQKRQLYILVKPIVWLSFAAVIFSIGAMFGFYSYMSEFLLNVTKLDFTLISITLFIYGLSSVLGNFLAGKLLTNKPKQTLFITPLIMLVLYSALFFFEEFSTATISILAILGIFAGILNSGAHFMLTNPVPRASEFANGIFISTANIGTSLGTVLCGLFITLEGSKFSVLAPICLIIATIIMIYIRNHSNIKA